MATAATPAPQALILDFGGVISRTLFETHALTEQALGLPPGTLTWRGPFDPDSDALWRDMQAGRLSERDYWHTRTREVGRLLGEDWPDMQTLVQRARGAEPERILRPETVALIETARAAGIRLAILSNELDLFYGPSLRQRLGCLRHFELIVDATYTGCLKPDAQAYAQCLHGLQLPAAQTVFVDDQVRNVQGARDAGLHAVWFDVRCPQRACDEAARLLALPFT
jgi:putative hydrolase of the HAD superfamily